MKNLPSKLSISPLLEVVFEIRFDSDFPFSVIAPGVLFGKTLSEIKTISLPAQQIPKEIREKDPNFKYAPLLKFEKEDLFFFMSDHSFCIGTQNTYKGWKVFRTLIIESLKKLGESHLLNGVNRFSLKYVNLIDGTFEKELKNIVRGHLQLGSVNLEETNLQIRSEVRQAGTVFSNLCIFNPARADSLPSGEAKFGCVIEIDTIQKSSMEDFVYKYKTDSVLYLDTLHEYNKKLFFSILNEDLIERLGPSYEH